MVAFKLNTSQTLVLDKAVQGDSSLFIHSRKTKDVIMHIFRFATNVR